MIFTYDISSNCILDDDNTKIAKFILKLDTYNLSYKFKNYFITKVLYYLNINPTKDYPSNIDLYIKDNKLYIKHIIVYNTAFCDICLLEFITNKKYIKTHFKKTIKLIE